MKLEPQDLTEIASRTLDHYNGQAEQFWQGTCGHDVSQNIDALLRHLAGEPPFSILDFGCGPGRDLKTLSDLGHIAIGLDGAQHFVAMARAHSGCEV
ncbi:MAG TPA: class I SAM-dependent methyltransferase, partial [Telmatospirillum sp.]|nr:class I SAM-dependent methyltransferase [Telmatospirillum sp.]